jgi:hypothetical protein
MPHNNESCHPPPSSIQAGGLQGPPRLELCSMLEQGMCLRRHEGREYTGVGVKVTETPLQRYITSCFFSNW